MCRSIHPSCIFIIIPITACSTAHPRSRHLVDTASRMGMPALALTDHGNLFGAIQFYTTARKKGLKPIIGCEIYVAKESRHKKTGGGDQSNHLVLLAENLTGYHNLSKLVSYGYLEGFLLQAPHRQGTALAATAPD